jgi:hypothetical protein
MSTKWSALHEKKLPGLAHASSSSEPWRVTVADRLCPPTCPTAANGTERDKRDNNDAILQEIAGLPVAPQAATRFLQFVNASPTPFHAVHNAALRLEKAGFRKVGHPHHTPPCLHSRYRLERKTTGSLPLNPVVNITSRGELL